MGRRHAASVAGRSQRSTRLFLVCGVLAVSVIVRAPSVSAAPSSVLLGTAASYAVLAGSTITNTGATRIGGNLGLSPGTVVTGFPPGKLTGNSDVANTDSAQAKADLATAYDEAAGRTVTAIVPTELGGTTKTPGVYASAAGTFGINGTLTIDGQGEPDGVFIFQSASTLVTASSSRIDLINGARAQNIFWQVGTSATLGSNSTLHGNILALASITVTMGVSIDGRVLARDGVVTLDTDRIVMPTPDVSGSTVTVIVTSIFGLSISAPRASNLGSALPGSTVSGDLGDVTVTDDRALPDADWTATVSATDFTTGGPTPLETIPALDVSYWSGPATATTGSGEFSPGQPTAADAESIDTPQITFSHSSGSGANAATWHPTLLIAVPAAAVIGSYTGTVTYSVI